MPAENVIELYSVNFHISAEVYMTQNLIHERMIDYLIQVEIIEPPWDQSNVTKYLHRSQLVNVS